MSQMKMLLLVFTSMFLTFLGDCPAQDSNAPFANKTSIMDLPSDLLPLPSWNRPRFELCGTKFQVDRYDEAPRAIMEPNFYEAHQDSLPVDSSTRVLFSDAKQAAFIVERHLFLFSLVIAFLFRARLVAIIERLRAPVVIPTVTPVK